MVNVKVLAALLAGIGALLFIFREPIGRFLQQAGAGFAYLGQSVIGFTSGLGAGLGYTIASPIVGIFSAINAVAQAICGVIPSWVPRPAFCGGGGGASTSGAGQGGGGGGGGGGGRVIEPGPTGCPQIYGPAVGHQVPGALVPYNVQPNVCGPPKVIA